MPNGTFVANVADFGVSETKAGLPQISVTFDVNAENGTSRYSWFGSLKAGKAREITIKALVTLGFTGKNLADLADPAKEAIAIGTEVEVVLAEETYDGTTRTKIQWINKVGGGGGIAKLDADTAKAKLAALGDIGGELMLAQQGGAATGQAAKPEGDPGF